MSKILVLHHIDRDGYMAAACIKDRVVYIDEDEDTELMFIPIDHGAYIIDMDTGSLRYTMEEAFNNADKIYLVDYGINNYMDAEFIYSYKDKMVWIDHHLTSIEFTEKEFPELKEIAGLRIIGLSGALLTWIYETGQTKTLIENQNIYDQKDIEEIHLMKMCEVPMIIRYTHKYDIWDLDESTIKFNYGYRTLDVDEMVKDIEDDILTDGRISLSAIGDGEIIKDYVIEKHEDFIKNNGINFYIEFNSNYYNTLMVNMIQPSLLNFGKYADMFDLLIAFSVINSGTIKYTIYKGKKCEDKDLKVSDIAKCFGGGGHAGAAGFVLKDGLQLLPDRYSSVNINVIGDAMSQIKNVKFLK